MFLMFSTIQMVLTTEISTDKYTSDLGPCNIVKNTFGSGIVCKFYFLYKANLRALINFKFA